MNIASLLRSLRKRLLSGATPRRKPFRSTSSPLGLEALELRIAPTGTPIAPTIKSVTPTNLTVWNSATAPTPSPTITITFNEAMFNDTNTHDAAYVDSVTNPANYEIFNDSTGATVTVNKIDYAVNLDTTSTVTLHYTTGPGNVLADGTYTVFVQGDQLFESTQALSLAQPGQMVVANPQSDTVSTINTSLDLGLHAPQSYPLPNDTSFSPSETPIPAAVCIADLNGDGVPDIAVANATTGSVEVFLGQSNGGFDSAPDTILYPGDGDTQFTGIVAANLGQPKGAGSGLLDLVTSDATGDVNVFLNGTAPGDTTLTFSDSAGDPDTSDSYFVGTDLVGIVTGIFSSGFGARPDIAVVDNTVDANGKFDVLILTGDGGGTLDNAGNNSPVTIPIGTATTGLEVPTGIAIGNLDGGKLPDLAVSGSNGVLPLVNNTTTGGNITFNVAAPVLDVTGSTVAFNAVAIGTLSTSSLGAKVQDIAVTTAGPSANLYVYQNDGSGGFTTTNSAPFPLTGLISGLAVADLNGDGLAEAIVTSPDTNAIEVLANTSTGAGINFDNPVSYQVDYGPMGLTVGNLNGGTTPDIVTFNYTLDNKGNVATGPSFSVVYGNSDGTLADLQLTDTVSEITKAAPNPKPSAIAVGDLNGDGLADFVVADPGANQVEVYLATAPGVYAAPVVYTTLDKNGNGGDPVSVTIADLTGTTDPTTGLPILDIITADDKADNLGNYYISVLQNAGDGSGTFDTAPGGKATAFKVGQSPTQVQAGVFNAQNGKTAADLLIAHNGSSSKGVTYLANTTSGTTISFAAPVELAITSSNSNFSPTALVVGDFNNDGNLDFALLNSNPQALGVYLVEGDGRGDFGNVLGPYSLSPDLTPSAMAVGDFNRDGYLDLVIVGTPINSTTAAVETLLNNHGFGFQSSPVTTDTAIPGDAIINSVTVTDINDDPYPDIVVGTVFTPLSDNDPATVDNLFSLQGQGDGTFTNATPYEAGGEPGTTVAAPVPTNVAVISDPFMAVTTFYQAGPLVTDNLIANGSFNTPNLNGDSGTLDGWQTVSEQDSEGEWSVQQKSQVGRGRSVSSPLSGTRIINPPVGQYQALLDEYNLIPYQSGSPNPNLTGSSTGGYNGSYNGSNFLYQVFTLPANTIGATLTLDLYVNNTTGKWFSGPASTPLDFNVPQANEQVLIDFIAAPSSPAGVTTALSLTGGVVFQTSTTTPAIITPGRNGPNITFTLSSNFLSTYAGQTIALRIAGVNNQPGPLIIGVDNVQLTTTFEDTSKAKITGLQLRNPGAIINGLPTTTDATIVGRVSDLGGVQAFTTPGYLQISTTNTTLASGLSVTYVTRFDALGDFSVMLPNLAYGSDLISISLVDQAGNTYFASLPFFYQGPSITGWQSVGPGGISTAGITGISYTSVDGRVTALAADPSDPSGNTIYAGSENGGVWKSTDGGANWTPLTDFVTNQSGQPVNVPVGAVAVAPSNPKVVYVATGDGNDLPDAQGGIGVLVSLNGGLTWTVDGNSGTVLAGARVTAIAVDPNNANNVYVAVAAGAPGGPGVYRSLNALSSSPTWTNILTIANMSYPGYYDSSGTFHAATNVAAGTTLASVTSLVLDPFNSSQLLIGLGNIGLVAASSTAGVWVSPNANNPSGATWTAKLGGDTAPSIIPNNTVPFGATLGRVTVAEGSGIGGGEQVFYALIGTIGNATVSGGSENFGTFQGLYKTSDGGLNWTHVQLLQQTGLKTDSQGNTAPVYTAINLMGNDANNTGAIVVDPTDPSVVYIGGSDSFDTSGNAYLDHGLIRVDTGDMLDASPAALAVAKEIDAAALADGIKGWKAENNGDDIVKEETAFGTSNGYYDPTVDTFAYKSEGVSWYDVTTGLYEGGGGEGTDSFDPAIGAFIAPFGGAGSAQGAASAQLPDMVMSLTSDAQGRLLIGTEEGLWRATVHSVPYDFTSDSGGIVAYFTNDFVQPTASVRITTLNNNLQIEDITSVATDPLSPGTYYAAGYGTGIERTSPGSASAWQTMGLNGPKGQVDAGSVLAAAPSPTAPAGTPTTIYVNWAYTITGSGYAPQVSTQGGAVGSFSVAKSSGISINDNAGFFPVLTIDPTKIFDDNLYQDELLFGTSEVYTTRTSSNLWNSLTGGKALSKKAGSVVSAAAIAPSNDTFFYAGTNLGEVFVSKNNGADGWPESDAGLPVNIGAPVTGFAVNPNNPLIAYVTYGSGGTGNYSHVYVTTNGGQLWTSIQGNLPNVAAYSIVTDPRPQTNAPSGFLYIGTQVGAFVSANSGLTWKALGQGLPNVPVVNLTFNQSLEQLVAATEGRGVYVLSTDRDGAYVNSVSPNTPQAPPISTVTVTFNKQVAAFPVSQVTKITGPNGLLLGTTTLAAAVTATQTTITVASVAAMPASGAFRIQIGNEALLVTKISGTTLFVQRGYLGTTAVTHAKGTVLEFGSFAGQVQVNDVTPAIQGQSDLHNQFAISFPTQSADGVYTFSIGPSILDNVGNPMDQLQNHTVSGDAFQVALNSTDDGQYVTGLYHDLLGVSPTTTQFISLLGVIDPTRFAALPTIVSPLVGGMNARTELIDELYSSSASPLSTIGIGNLLPNDPNLAADEAASLASLQKGSAIEAIISGIINTATFYTNAGNTDTAWIQAVIADLIGPGANPNDVATYSKQLTTLEATLSPQAARQKVGVTILTSPEYVKQVITNVFENFLGRAPTAADLSTWSAVVGKVAGSPGGLTGDEKLLQGVLGKQEYFMDQTDAGGLHTNVSWVDSVYADLQITGMYSMSALAAAETTTDTNLLNAYATQRQSAARSLLTGTAYRTIVITNAYQTYTGAAPTATQLSTWLTNFAHGQTQENLFASLMATSAFYSNAPNILGVSTIPTNTTFVEAAFTLLFPGFNYTNSNASNPDDISYWTTRMAKGMTQAQVAAGLLALPLYLTDANTGLITRLYKQYTGQAATTTQINSWTNNLKNGYHDEDLIASLLATLAYFNQKHKFP